MTTRAEALLKESTRDKWYTKGIHNSRISRVSNINTARKIRDNHSVCDSSIVKGDDDKYWVVPTEDAERLEAEYNMGIVK